MCNRVWWVVVFWWGKQLKIWLFLHLIYIWFYFLHFKARNVSKLIAIWKILVVSYYFIVNVNLNFWDKIKKFSFARYNFSFFIAFFFFYDWECLFFSTTPYCGIVCNFQVLFYWKTIYTEKLTNVIFPFLV